MKKMHILIVAAVTLIISSTGYTAGTEGKETTNSSSAMNKDEKMPGMMGRMHHEGMMHHGMMGHQMMHSGMSPVTVLIYPGMMPMMGHGMRHHEMEGDHKRSEMHREKMEQRHSRKNKHMEHMQDMEQRLANIEKLLGELVEELQKKD